MRSGEQINDHWADGPIKWIMTSDEKRAWSQLTPGGEWQEFVDKFWESRNPQPGNPDNPYRTSFERRVAFAGGHLDVKAGQAVIAHSGEWVQYSTPTDDGAEYIAVCLPAFTPARARRNDGS